jgi:hypothetical protein
MLSNELEIVTDLWKKRALYQIKKLGVDKHEALFHLFQKTILMIGATGAPETNEDIALILADFGEFLNAEQQAGLAMKYMQSCNIQSRELAGLKHRIFMAEPRLQQVTPKPQVPFTVSQIRIQVQLTLANAG